MSIISFVKGKLKQREVRKLVPDENFEFDKVFYGDTNIIDGFNFIYCNNYTDKFIKSSTNKECLSFISCVISLPAEIKTFIDLGNFVNGYIEIEDTYHPIFKYRNIYIVMGTDKIQLYLRGDIQYYNYLCENIHNNIFTRYIRNNIFVDGVYIETPNEYLDKMYNSINYPNKEMDILFIEDNTLCKEFSPVIGLSLSNKNNKFDSYIKDNNFIIENNRVIIYKEIDKLSDEEIYYLVNNVKYGDKLLDLLHDNNEYSDIDEIIEE